jgi:glycosyltransferase involved in cell wall biosynthesis
MIAAALKRAGYHADYGAAQTLHDSIVHRYDVIVGSRLAQNLDVIQQSFDAVKRLGKVIFVDYDDALLSIPEHNPAYLKDTSTVEGVARMADGLVVTNDVLAASFRPYNRNIRVIPNRVYTKAWPKPQRSGPLTIGVTGSPSHIRDWELIAGPMQAIRKKYPDVQFLVAGFLPNFLRDVATEYVEWVDILEYPHLINRIDIGLCPLPDSHFNRCKSPIKAYELGLASAAVVGSPTQYQTVLQGRGTIARTEQEWFDGIERYIINQVLRLQHAAALHAFVRKQDIDAHIRAIAAVYADLYKAAKR